MVTVLTVVATDSPIKSNRNTGTSAPGPKVLLLGTMLVRSEKVSPPNGIAEGAAGVALVKLIVSEELAPFPEKLVTWASALGRVLRFVLGPTSYRTK